MSNDIPGVIVGASRPTAGGPAVKADPKALWKAAGTVAIALSLAGLVDLTLAFVPARMSEPAWLFSVLTGVLSGLPIFTIGIITGVLAGLSGGSRGRVIFFSALAGVGTVLVLVALAVFISEAKEVFAAARPEVHGSLQKQIFRSLLSGVVFGGLMVFCSLLGIKSLRHPSLT